MTPSSGAPAENPERRPVLLLLSGSRRVLDKALALGLDVVHLQAPTMADPSLDPLCLHAETVDFLDVRRVLHLARGLHDTFSFAGVVSNHEPACAVAEAIALDLGLTAPGDGVAALLRDKARMHEATDGDPSLRTPWSPVTAPGDICAVAEAAGWPVVVKPVDGSASLGVLRVDSPEEVDDAWRRIRETLDNTHRYHEVLPVSGYLAEPFATGEEYSVETFTRGGAHEIRAIVRKTVDQNFVETGHLVPAPLAADTARQVVARVTAFLDKVGLCEGPAHTEVILGRGDIHVLESHARTGGDEIPALVELVTGRDVEADMLAHACGLPLPPPRRPLAPAAAKHYLLADRSGTVASLTGLSRAREVPGVHDLRVWVQAGDTVRPAMASWERLGEIVALGAGPDAAADAASQASRLIALRMEKQ